jgi:putative transposase
MSELKPVYRTHQVWIKPGHRLYPYLEQVCQDAKNLYNTTNFYIRQVFTAFGQKQPLQPLQQQVVDTLQTHIDAMNERLSVKNRSRPFQLPSQESPFVNYRFLDALFKVME